MKKTDSNLDNPVWYSLKETHKSFSVQTGNAGFYHPDFCPFGSFMEDENLANELDNYAKLVTNFYIVGQKPKYNSTLQLKKELVCNQMILETQLDPEDDNEILRLGPENRDDLIGLVNLVQPGFFKKNTADLGAYYGIYKSGNLIAVTGERMKMQTFTEVSAVVTHPNHIKQGHAKKLITHTTNKIFKENKTPYLHVDENNTSAISLYKKLGFKVRRKITFWNFIKS